MTTKHGSVLRQRIEEAIKSDSAFAQWKAEELDKIRIVPRAVKMTVDHSFSAIEALKICRKFFPWRCA